MTVTRILQTIPSAEPNRQAEIVLGPNGKSAGAYIEICTTDSVPVPQFSEIAGQRGLTVWLTGLSGAGKSTISAALNGGLRKQGLRAEVIDADVLRTHLNSDLGFGKRDRDENLRRIGFIAHLLTRHGVIAIVAAISPYRATRDELRRRIRSFIEVHVNAPLRVCEERDPKGLYKRARLGEIVNVAGLDDPYEPPYVPEVTCNTDKETVENSTQKVLAVVLEHVLQMSGSAWAPHVRHRSELEDL